MQGNKEFANFVDQRKKKIKGRRNSLLYLTPVVLSYNGYTVLMKTIQYLCKIQPRFQLIHPRFQKDQARMDPGNEICCPSKYGDVIWICLSDSWQNDVCLWREQYSKMKIQLFFPGKMPWNYVQCDFKTKIDVQATHVQDLVWIRQRKKTERAPTLSTVRPRLHLSFRPFVL